MSDRGGIAAAAAPRDHDEALIRIDIARTPVDVAWNVQGDPAHAPFMNEVERQFQIRMPSVANTTAQTDTLLALWLGPSSWLLLQRGAETVPALADFEPARVAVNAAGGALFDVSASRVALTLRGAHAADVLAKSCPLDFHLRVFAVGGCAQSLFGHVNALFYRADSNAFMMLVARSFAHDVWHTLSTSASQYGFVALPDAHGAKA